MLQGSQQDISPKAQIYQGKQSGIASQASKGDARFWRSFASSQVPTKRRVERMAGN